MIVYDINQKDADSISFLMIFTLLFVGYEKILQFFYWIASN